MAVVAAHKESFAEENSFAVSVDPKLIGEVSREYSDRNFCIIQILISKPENRALGLR